jgi:hypothetical protein
MPTKFLSPDEARELLERRDRENAAIRANAPQGMEELYARFFPPVSDEIFRQAMEMALLGELRHPHSLPPLKDGGDCGDDEADEDE